MIYKDLDPYSGDTTFEAASRQAEERMAAALTARFKDSPGVDVLHGLRLEFQDEESRIDHLLLMPAGLLILDSGSGLGKVQIMDDGQWVRWHGEQAQGMRSPLEESRRQAVMLKALLNQAAKRKGAFDAIPVAAMVTIAETGEIVWPKSGPLPEVCKAARAPERIEALSKREGPLNQEGRQKIAAFLRHAHKPATPTPVTAPEAGVVVLVKGAYPPKRCKHCYSIKLDIRSGPDGYYFNCGVCDRDTPLNFTCPVCGGEGCIRQDGSTFYAECKACDASKLFFTNL